MVFYPKSILMFVKQCKNKKSKQCYITSNISNVKENYPTEHTNLSILKNKTFQKFQFSKNPLYLNSTAQNFNNTETKLVQHLKLSLTQNYQLFFWFIFCLYEV